MRIVVTFIVLAAAGCIPAAAPTPTAPAAAVCPSPDPAHDPVTPPVKRTPVRPVLPNVVYRELDKDANAELTDAYRANPVAFAAKYAGVRWTIRDGLPHLIQPGRVKSRAQVWNVRAGETDKFARSVPVVVSGVVREYEPEVFDGVVFDYVTVSSP